MMITLKVIRKYIFKENKMKLRQLLLLSVLAISAALPAIASANDLMIANDTNKDLSFSINNSCIAQTIYQHVENKVFDKVFQDNCDKNQATCTLEFYNQPYCQGTHIETVGYSSDSGIVSLFGDDNDGDYYYWAANGFELYISNH